ncbi:uncharacterized protein [Narcine bancroftii]|uniref:uncharacterized protein n=1 Tax=Narcine bancroftii TaxID=1343680 RepID=UPI00383180F3
MKLVALFLLAEAMLFHPRINGLQATNSKHILLHLTSTYSQNDTQLNLSRKNISSIPVKAFQSFKALEILELSHNNLTFDSLPCGSLTITTLRHLNIASNQLEHAPSCLPTALEFLDLSKNIIQQIEFSVFVDLHNLSVLLLNHNKITEIATLGIAVPQLVSLDLSYNNLTRLQWKFQGPNLTMLRLEGNPLQELNPFEFGPFPKLHYLNLSSTSLESCSYKAFASETEHIKILDLSENFFKTLDPQCFEGLSNLQILWMRRMPFLHSLPVDLFLYTSRLIHLNLAENSQLHLVNSSMFEQLQYLQTLSLKSCNLTEFRPWKYFPNSTVTVTLSENHLGCRCELAWLIREPEKLLLSRANYTRCEESGSQRKILLVDFIDECEGSRNYNKLQDLQTSAKIAQNQQLGSTTAIYHNPTAVNVKTNNKLPIQNSNEFQHGITISSSSRSMNLPNASSDSNSGTLQPKERLKQNDQTWNKIKSWVKSSTLLPTTTRDQMGSEVYPVNARDLPETSPYPTNVGQTEAKIYLTNRIVSISHPLPIVRSQITTLPNLEIRDQIKSKTFPTTGEQMVSEPCLTAKAGQRESKTYPVTRNQTVTGPHPLTTRDQTVTGPLPPTTRDQTVIEPHPPTTRDQTVTRPHPLITRDQTVTRPHPPTTRDQTVTEPHPQTTRDQTVTEPHQPTTRDQTVIEPHPPTTRYQTVTGPHPPTTRDQIVTGPHTLTTRDQTVTGPHTPTTRDQTVTGPHPPTTRDQTVIGPHPPTTRDQMVTGPHPPTTRDQTVTGPHPPTTRDQMVTGPHTSTTRDQMVTGPHPPTTRDQTVTGPHPPTTRDQTVTRPHTPTTRDQTVTGPHTPTTRDQTVTRPHPPTTRDQTVTGPHPPTTRDQTVTEPHPPTTRDQTVTKPYQTIEDQTEIEPNLTITREQSGDKHYPIITREPSGSKITLQTTLPEFSSISTTKRKGPIFIQIEDDEIESLEKEEITSPTLGDCNYDPCRHWQVPCHDLQRLTGCLCPATTGEDVIPDPVKIQKVIKISDNSAEIYWCAPSSTVLYYYIIYQSDDNRRLYKTDTIKPTYRRYTLRDLTSDSTYHTCVVAVNKAGSSIASSIWPSKGLCYIFKTKPNYNNIFYIASTLIIAILFILVIILSVCLCKIHQKGRLTHLSRLSLDPLSLQNPAFDDHLELADPRAIRSRTPDSEQIL